MLGCRSTLYTAIHRSHPRQHQPLDEVIQKLTLLHRSPTYELRFHYRSSLLSGWLYLATVDLLSRQIGGQITSSYFYFSSIAGGTQDEVARSHAVIFLPFSWRYKELDMLTLYSSVIKKGFELFLTSFDDKINSEILDSLRLRKSESLT